jgi:DNA-binding CsgD family transcriptional regulator
MLKALPAGLINDQVEFFRYPDNIEQVYFLTNSSAARVKTAPAWIREILTEDMANFPEKVEALVDLGIEGEAEQLEMYSGCLAGVLNHTPDIIDGRFMHTEYVPCSHRGSCIAEGRLCNALCVGPNDEYLTRREIEVLVLIATGLQNKEIADKLKISQETVKVHIKHIHAKAGLNNRVELFQLANQKNLIQ